MLHFFLPTASTALALLLTACSASTPAPSTTTLAGSPAATAIRSIDWPTIAYPNLDLSAGDELGTPHYFDVTSDGIEDAALEGLAMTPGGNAYTTYIFVFTVPSGASEPALLATLIGGDRADGAIRLTGVDAAGLHLARAIHGPEDAMCCPSTEQHELWVWDGSQFNEDPTRRHVAPTEP
ncbi:MAG: hypothetical protein IPH72_31475 [Sandaracinaceae bacterium]|nr:hypothetical protein [Sandaracinaceae bacterium]